MAFTGYVFESASAIRPYLEAPDEGPSSRFCSELAKELNCYVVAGYPEKYISDSGGDDIGEKKIADDEEVTDSQDSHISLVGYNSAFFYGPNGEWMGGYRKTNLFEVDKSWAFPGTGFATFHLPDPLRTVSLGICMDLNPQPPAIWTSEDGPYEIADYCLKQKSNVLLLLNSWLDSENYPDDENDFHIIRYWAARLRPLWVDHSPTGSLESSSEEDEEPDSNADEDNDIIVIVCNRTGEENGKKFAGTSAIYRMRPGSGKPQLIDMMTRTEEDVRIWDIQV